MAKRPLWYDDYHASLVKNFYLPDNEYAPEPGEGVEEADVPLDQEDVNELLEELTPTTNVQATGRFILDDRVQHRKFGVGRVTSIDGNKIEVQFEDAGLKRVMDSFLQPVEKTKG